MNTKEIWKSVDRTFDQMLRSLGVPQEKAYLISHWQDGIGYRLQVTRKSDGAIKTKLVRLDGSLAA